MTERSSGQSLTNQPESPSNEWRNLPSPEPAPLGSGPNPLEHQGPPKWGVTYTDGREFVDAIDLKQRVKYIGSLSVERQVTVEKDLGARSKEAIAATLKWAKITADALTSAGIPITHRAEITQTWKEKSANSFRKDKERSEIREAARGWLLELPRDKSNTGSFVILTESGTLMSIAAVGGKKEDTIQRADGSIERLTEKNSGSLKVGDTLLKTFYSETALRGYETPDTGSRAHYMASRLTGDTDTDLGRRAVPVSVLDPIKNTQNIQRKYATVLDRQVTLQDGLAGLLVANGISAEDVFGPRPTERNPDQSNENNISPSTTEPSYTQKQLEISDPNAIIDAEVVDDPLIKTESKSKDSTITDAEFVDEDNSKISQDDELKPLKDQESEVPKNFEQGATWDSQEHGKITILLAPSGFVEEFTLAIEKDGQKLTKNVRPEDLKNYL